MKRKILFFMIGIFTLLILFGVQVFKRQDSGKIQNAEEYIGIEDRITRAEVARMISLLNYDREEIKNLERTIDYTDTDATKWYDKYINSFAQLGFLSDAFIEEKQFHPMAYVNFKDCKDLSSVLSEKLDNNELGIKLEEVIAKLQGKRKETTELSMEEWRVLYEIIYNMGYQMEFTEKTLYFIDTWENTDELDKWQTATNEGIFYGDGLNFVQYLNQSCKVYVKEKEILCVLGISDEKVKIANAWIQSCGEENLTIYTEGFSRELSFTGTVEEKVEKQVADIYIEDGQITSIQLKPDRIKGRILVVKDNSVEIEGYGQRRLAEDFCIYRIYDEVSLEQRDSLVVGYENVEFVLMGDEISAALIMEDVAAENIRVLIKTNGFEDFYHDKIKITSNKAFNVEKGGEQKEYKAEKTITIKHDEEENTERIRITTEEGGKITVSSISRNGIHPSYEGSMEIADEANGLLLINELPLEKYLYGVVPSEMPSSYDLEALKAQAVCARSYAYKHLLSNSLSRYGAHVDDSVSYQVYNNIPTNKRIKKAVDATRGKILMYQGKAATAYYFSSSCGYTSNAAQIWGTGAEFEYLKGDLQFVKENKKARKKYEDLSEEKTFRSFMKQSDYKTYDSDDAWYRWKVTIPNSQIKKNIDANLEKRYSVNPSMILTKQEDGTYLSAPIDTIGNVKKLSITKRQTSGMISELIIEGSKATIKVNSEYNIRLLLAPGENKVFRQDESYVSNMSMLPSASFYIEETEDGFLLSGGGNGHGVGMSQVGAGKMAEIGFDFEEILKHYYPGTEVKGYK